MVDYVREMLHVFPILFRGRTAKEIRCDFYFFLDGIEIVIFIQKQDYFICLFNIN